MSDAAIIGAGKTGRGFLARLLSETPEAYDRIVLIDRNEELADRLIADGVISGGMIPKIENAFDALRRGVRQVIITRSDNIDGSRGTIIR